MDKNIEYTKQLFDIIARLKKAGFQSACDEDLRPSEEMFLVKIDMMGKDGVKINDLVNKLKLAPSTISTMLKALEELDYIAREKNLDNGREVIVYITEKGTVRLEKAKQNHFDMVKSLINFLGDKDAAKLVEILNKTVIFFENKKTDRGEK